MTPSTDLDEPDTYTRLDPSGLRDRIAGLADQCQRAWQEVQAFHLPASYGNARTIALLGVGGSAIGGDLIAGLAALDNGPQVTTCRSPHLPGWVGPDTLALVSSYSGNTEETLAMYRQAREKGAHLVALTSGGELARLARQDGTPCFTISYDGEPRSALGYSFVAPLALLCGLGLVPDKSSDLRNATRIVQDLAIGLGPDTPHAQNQAKDIAAMLQNRLPVLYGAGFLSGVARRWKTQLNENSKVWSFWEELPEASHNSIEAARLHQTVGGQVSVILLHSYFLPPRTTDRFQAVEGLLVREGIPYRQLDGAGESPLSHLLSTVLLGDYASYYLAMLNGRDPSPLPVIEGLKQQPTHEKPDKGST